MLCVGCSHEWVAVVFWVTGPLTKRDQSPEVFSYESVMYRLFWCCLSQETLSCMWPKCDRCCWCCVDMVRSWFMHLCSLVVDPALNQKWNLFRLCVHCTRTWGSAEQMHCVRAKDAGSVVSYLRGRLLQWSSSLLKKTCSAQLVVEMSHSEHCCIYVQISR